MALPDDITLTVPEVRQAAVRTATRYGIPFDNRLVEVIDDILEDIVLAAAIGPARRGPFDD